MKRSFPTVHDVFALAPNPDLLRVGHIAEALHIDSEVASDLKRRAIEWNALYGPPNQPTARESFLMREFHFSLSEAQAASQLIQTGDIQWRQ